MPLTDLETPLAGDLWRWNGSVWVPNTVSFAELNLDPEPWIYPAYNANWGDAGGLLGPARYRKIFGGVACELAGWAVRTAGATLSPFTLPVGYRPLIDGWYYTVCSGGHQVWSLSTLGVFGVGNGGLYTGTPTSFSLDGVVFPLT